MESLEKVLLIVAGVVILSSFLFWIIPNFMKINEYRNDNDPPIWDQIPEDQTIVYGEDFGYRVKAFDISGINHYWINDTSNFFIYNENEFIGLIVNRTILNVGKYWLEVRAYDPLNNFISTIIKITVKN
ncbi:MAG: hypothetical protein ACFFCV_11720 [Promethearchaeota archaeon]